MWSCDGLPSQSKQCYVLKCQLLPMLSGRRRMDGKKEVLKPKDIMHVNLV